MAPLRLRVEIMHCEGAGVCAELLPELIDLDEWGYPILRREPVPTHLLPLARRACELCPALALHLEPAPVGSRPRH